MLLKAWRWYQYQLAKNPVPTQVISSGVLWAAGDVGAQFVTFHARKKNHAIQVKEETNFRINWQRVLTTSMFGFCFVGPLGHYWYEGLEHVTKNRFKLKPGSVSFVIAKLAADSGLFGPIHLLAFFTYMGLASGKSFPEVKSDIKRDFLPAFMTEGVMWQVVQVVNFRFVPVRYQLLYVNLFCLLDSTFLSWFEQQEDAQWKKWLKSFISTSSKENDQHK